MSRVGTYKFSTMREIPLSDHSDKSVGVDIKCECEIYADEDGIEVESFTAKIVERELEDDECVDLGLCDEAIESFSNNTPVPPDVGDRFIDRGGGIWTVLGTSLLEGKADQYTMISRGDYTKLIHTAELVYGGLIAGDKPEWEQLPAWLPDDGGLHEDASDRARKASERSRSQALQSLGLSDLKDPHIEEKLRIAIRDVETGLEKLRALRSIPKIILNNHCGPFWENRIK